MFNMHDFIMTGLLDAVGNMPDYWIIFNATGWLEKGTLTESDLGKVQAKIIEKNKALEVQLLPLEPALEDNPEYL